MLDDEVAILAKVALEYGQQSVVTGPCGVEKVTARLVIAVAHLTEKIVAYRDSAGTVRGARWAARRIEGNEW